MTRYGLVYWNEAAYYELSPAEAEAIERATAALRECALVAVQHVIDTERYREFGLPDQAVPLIRASWDGDAPSIYGRMDLAMVDGVPKLLEYNADTPTMLLEAAVVQWQWRTARFPDADQFNSIHEKLIGEVAEPRTVRHAAGALRAPRIRRGPDDHHLPPRYGAASWSGDRGAARPRNHHSLRGFTDLQERSIGTIFKLYPWEWTLCDEFAQHLDPSVQWIEPPWKMLLSNKAILPILWELFPGHPNLLPAFRSADPLRDGWVRKPRLGREGENIAIEAPGVSVSTQGGYADSGFVYQAYAPLPIHDGHHVLIGSWEVDGEPAGVGIRESVGPVTRNESPFVPHVIR